MEFALQYELQVPRPWGPSSESDVYFQAIEQIKEGERVGFSTVWMVEHHFLPEFSHCSAPEIFLAAVSQQTSTIRIGHGVVLAPPPYNHPVRVAERIGALDILSRGRVEFGLGRSITEAELGGFNVDPAESRPMMLETIELIPKFWLNEGPVGYDGKYVSMPPREVLPKPVQRPHPPMWMACTSPDSYVLAGELGLGVLGFGNAVDPPGVARRIQAYRDGLTRADTQGRRINDKAGIFLMCFCAETDEQAQRVAREPMTKYLDDTFVHFLHWGKGGVLPAGYEWYAEAAKKLGAASQSQKFDYLLDNHMLLCGSPATIRDTLNRYTGTGLDQLIMGVQYMGMPHEAIMNSIRLLGDEVLPHFAGPARG